MTSRVMGVDHEATAFSGGLLGLLGEGRHDFLAEPFQLLHHDRVRSADGVAGVDAFETRVHILDLHKLLDNEIGWAAQPTSSCGIVLDLRQVSEGGLRWVSEDLDLFGGNAPTHVERCEHLHILVVIVAGLLDRPFGGLGDVEGETHEEIAA